jgi:hypothetical protein
MKVARAGEAGGSEEQGHYNYVHVLPGSQSGETDIEYYDPNSNSNNNNNNNNDYYSSASVPAAVGGMHAGSSNQDSHAPLPGAASDADMYSF